MNIDNIRCFISLAECLNFTRAAEKEHITQTAMSRKISTLEKELDVLLLYRDTRQVELTMAGSEFYEKAKELVKLYDHTVKRVHDVQNDFRTLLKLGVGVYDHVLLNRFLNTYKQMMPSNVKLHCMQAPYPALAKDFEDRLIDVIISTDQFEEEFIRMDAEHLGSFTIYSEGWNILLHKDNPLAKLGKVPLNMLDTQTLITMEPGNSEHVRHYFTNWFMIKDSIFVNSFDTKLVMVNANLGVAFAPPFVFPVANRYQNIVLRTTTPPYKARKFCVYYWKNNPNPAVHDFIKKYREFCKKNAL